MKTFIILSEKDWHEELFINLKRSCQEFEWVMITTKEDFTLQRLERLNPEKIFIPHWSYIIPSAIYKNFDCVLFHMTDLPFGRGGTPLQNLIVRGIKETKISALRVEKGIDTGPIFLKQPLSLKGNAKEIFIRAANIIEEMILKIIRNNLKPIPQSGEVTIFKRRIPEDGNLSSLNKVDQIYDYIRMLDADGYPPAFLDFGTFRIEFSSAQKQSNNSISADVRIIQK